MTRLFVVGARARDFQTVQDWLDVLDIAGCDVRLLTIERRPTDVHGPGARPQAFLPAPAKPGSSLRTRVIRRAARIGALLAPKRLRLLLSLRYGTLPTGAAEGKPHYIPLSSTVSWPAGWARAKRDQYVVVASSEAEHHVTSRGRFELGLRYANLVSRMRTGKVAPVAGAAHPDWQFIVSDPRVARLGFHMGDYVSDAIRMAMYSSPVVARSILDLAVAQNAADVGSVEHAAAREIVSLAERGERSASTAEIAAQLSTAADDAFEAGEHERAATLFTHLLTLVFFPGLHTATASSPIVDDPEVWLAPIRHSKLRHHIVNQARRAEGSSRREDDRNSRLMVLRGSYPSFSRPVLEALEASGRDATAVTPSDEDRLLAGVGPNADMVRILIGLGAVPSWDWLSEVNRSSRLFIDWADRAAAIAVSQSTADRIVLRVHSVDLLSGWIHLTALDKVDEIIVVSEPMADLVRRVVDVPSTTTISVLPNLIDVARFDRPKSPRASRTVAVVGWAQQVKDPVWALDVLAILRRADPTWRMLFVGNDFEARGASGPREYAARFRRRLLEEDVRAGVEFVGYTRDLPRVFHNVGFVLSSSLRESFGVALMEGIASGAVPIVRNWPTFRVVDAARRITDPRWVVDDPEEAAAAILRLGEEADRAAEGALAQRWLRDRAANEDVARRYVEIITGTVEAEA